MRAFETEKTEVAEIDRSVYDIKDKVNAAFEVNSGLTAEIVEFFGNLRPAYGVICILNPVIYIIYGTVVVQLHHKLHILSHSFVVISSCSNHHILFEKSKCSRYYQRAVEFIK